MNDSKITVLAIEDNPGDARLIHKLLADHGATQFRSEWADSLSAGLARLNKGGIDAVLCDLGLPDSQGLDTLAHVQAQSPQVPVIVLTALDDTELADTAVRAGAQDYLVKGNLNGDSLARAIRHAIERQQAEAALQESERRFREILENVELIAITLDVEGRITFCNDYLLRLTGRSRADVLGQNWFAMFVSPGLQVEQAFRLSMQQGTIFAHHENEILTVSGERRLVSWNNTLLRDTEDHVIGVTSLGEDITERQRAKEALTESALRFRSILDNIQDGYFEVDLAGNFTFFNPALVRMLGRPANELMGTNNRVYMTLEGGKAVFQVFNRIFQTGIPEQALDWDLVRPDGTLRSVEVSVSLIKAANGSSKGFRGTVRDITERKRAEALQTAVYQIAQSTELVDSLSDLFPQIQRIISKVMPAENFYIALFDQARNRLSFPYSIDKVDKTYEGEELEPGRGLTAYVLRTGKSLLCTDSIHTQLVQQGEIEVIGVPSIIWLGVPLIVHSKLIGVMAVQHYTNPLAYGEREQHVLEFVSSQVALAIDRKRAEEAVRESEERHRRLTENMSDTVWLMDMNLRTIYISPSVIRTRGYTLDEVNALPLDQQMTSDSLTRAMELFAEALSPENLAQPEPRTIYSVELEFYRKDGGKFWSENTFTLILDQNKQPVNILGNGRDITERKRAEEEILLRTQQLELLYDAGLTLNQTLEPRAQLECLCQIATKALRADNTCFFRYDAAQNDLHLEFGVGLVQEIDALRDLRFPLGAERGLIGWVAQNRVPFSLSDVTTDPRWIATDPLIHSALWVPILRDEQLLGVLSASSQRINAFTPQDERLFVLFANQVAVAMENARLFDETRKRLAEQEAVNQISTALRAAQTTEEMLPLLGRATQSVLAAAAVTIWLYDSEKNELCQATNSGFPNIDTRLRPGEGIAGQVFESGQIYISPEFKTDPRTHEAARRLVPPGLHGAAVPIRAADETIGVLFASVELPRQMTTGEVRLLTTLAEIAGNSIHRSRLYAQTELRLQQLQSLHAIDAAIASNLDLHVTLGIFLEHVLPQLRVDAGSILLLNPDTGMLEYAVGRGFRTPGIEHSRLRLGEGYAGRAALEKRTTHAADLSDIGASYVRNQLLAGEDFVAYYGVPLIAKGQVKGVLDIFQRSPLSPDPEWLEFMETLAGQAAIAVESASLYNDLQLSNVELTLAYDKTIEGWSRALDLRDKETEGHTQRVTQMAVHLARTMGMSEEDLLYVRRGGLLHDIGKMGVPDTILLKPGSLTDAEWVIMRKHPTHAYEMLSPIAFLQLALDIPYCHHEKWDGTGYPRGLKGEQIPLAARIFAIVDVWDALRSDRPYRPAWTEEMAFEYTQEQAGKHFDPKVVKVFRKLLQEQEIQYKLSAVKGQSLTR